MRSRNTLSHSQSSNRNNSISGEESGSLWNGNDPLTHSFLPPVLKWAKGKGDELYSHYAHMQDGLGLQFCLRENYVQGQFAQTRSIAAARDLLTATSEELTHKKDNQMMRHLGQPAPCWL